MSGLGIRSLVSKLERHALSQDGLGLVCVAAASLVQHEAGEEAKAGAAIFLRLHDDTHRGSPSFGKRGNRVIAPKRRSRSGKSSGRTCGIWIKVIRPFGAVKVARKRTQASSAPSCMICAAARPLSGAGLTVPSAWKGGLAITWS